MKLPEDFLSLLGAVIPTQAERTNFLASLQEVPVSGVRLNVAKLSAFATVGAEAVPTAPRVPWCAHAYLPKERLHSTYDPLFHAGCYYVQEPASMFPAHLLQGLLPTDRPVRVLDLCAAPGGKSTSLLNILPAGSVLVCNEAIKGRVGVLCENITKWGMPNVAVCHADASAFGKLEGVFDVVMVDAPCSGEGMFRKEPAALQEWSVELVELCRRRQQRILKDVWPALKPGGYLLYSTCTYNTRENEENVAFICREMGATCVPFELPSAWGVRGSASPEVTTGVARFFPHLTVGEGLFVALMQKPLDEHAGSTMAGRTRGRKADREQSLQKVGMKELSSAAWLKKLVQQAENIGCAALKTNGGVHIFPEDEVPFLQQLSAHLSLWQAGMPVAEGKGGGYIPRHGLAMLTGCGAEGVLPTEELTYAEALSYLRREVLPAKTAEANGYLMATYRGLHLGLLKHVGTRNNNLYPKECRIRSTYPPEAPRLLEQLLS